VDSHWAWADITNISVGQTSSLSMHVAPELVARVAALTGDDNPIHLDAESALAIGESRPPAHGVILLGLISRIIGTRLPGPGSIWFQNDIEFIAPIYPGDDLDAVVQVAQVSVAARTVVLSVEIRKRGGGIVARGRAKVRVPDVRREVSTHMNPSDRVALVTGGSRGLGRAVVETLTSGGMRVAFGYHTDRTSADDCLEKVQSAGGEALAISSDVSTTAGARDLFEQTRERFGRVDAIVHCATPPIAYRAYMDTDVDDFRRYFDTYVVGFHELVRLSVPEMKERRSGRIIGVLTSALAEVPQKLAAYITGKQALYGLCRALAVELGPWNITVNTVSPSLIVGRHADDLGMAARELMTRKTPLRRLPQAREVAHSVRFLLSDEAAFVSGANLPVTGGILF
jgi:3-oxoacyl-[acyl-carrier protein] reductase